MGVVPGRSDGPRPASPPMSHSRQVLLALDHAEVDEGLSECGPIVSVPGSVDP